MVSHLHVWSHHAECPFEQTFLHVFQGHLVHVEFDRDLVFVGANVTLWIWGSQIGGNQDLTTGIRLAGQEYLKF